jgi:hypothetical protein
MTTMLIVSAAAMLIAPAIAARIKRKASSPTSWDLLEVQRPAVPTFIEATSDLSNVRKRLNSTGHLDEDQREAIDTLQLALTAGSDQE